MNIYNILEFVQYRNEHDFNLLQESIIFGEFNSGNKIYTESSDSPIKNFFSKIIEKIREIIKNVKNSIAKLFKTKQYNDSIKKIEDLIDKNPSIKNKKVVIKRYNDLQKLNTEMLSTITNAKSKEELDKQMKRYKRIRNAIIGVGVAGAAITIAAAILIIKDKKESDKKFHDAEKDAETKINKLQQEMEQSSDKIEKESDKIKKMSDVEREKFNKAKEEAENKRKEFYEEMDLAKQKAYSITEITRNRTSDTVAETRDVVHAIIENGIVIGYTDDNGKPVKTTTEWVGGMGKVTIKKDSDGNPEYTGKSVDEEKSDFYKRKEEQRKKEAKERAESEERDRKNKIGDQNRKRIIEELVKRMRSNGQTSIIPGFDQDTETNVYMTLVDEPKVFYDTLKKYGLYDEWKNS